jgi:F420 biosynthesis protein FbiB-like protein
MDALEAIAARRSIRRFRSEPVPEEVLRRILAAATQAPSGKNRQPWRFVVVRGDERAEMVRLMRQGIARMQATGEGTGSAVASAAIMEQAPATVFVFNAHGKFPWLDHSVDDNFQEVVDVQSIGACIQNICLAALAMGLGSLWICDVFFAYEELIGWLGQQEELVAAVALGYSDERPGPRPRKAVEAVTTWR